MKQVCVKLSDEANEWLEREVGLRTRNGAVATVAGVIRDLIGKAMQAAPHKKTTNIKTKGTIK